MKWLLAGASGFLGTSLRVRLASEGHDVIRLVRREPATATEFRWDPDQGEIDLAAFDGVEAVVNLGGVGVFTSRWTEQRREAILSSRVNTTGTMARAIAGLDESRRPTLIQASGIARYGAVSHDQPFTEDDFAAPDFLAQATVQWEGAAQPAIDAGARTVFLRTSPVLDRSGGSFAPMKLAWSLGLGATLGDGRQHMPMISLIDYLGVVQWAADTPHASGRVQPHPPRADDQCRVHRRVGPAAAPATTDQGPRASDPRRSRRAERATARRPVRGAGAAAGRRLPLLPPGRLDHCRCRPRPGEHRLSCDL